MRMVNISLNKNAVKGDKSALNPNGIRIGTPAITTRGMKEMDMEMIAKFLDIVVKKGLQIQENSGKKISEFMTELNKQENIECLNLIKNDIKLFVNKFEFY